MFCSLVGVGCGCTKTSSPTGKTPKLAKPQHVLAQVGTSVITKEEFIQTYQQYGAGQTPRHFLQGMIRERMMLLEAKKRQLQYTPVVLHTVRQGLVRTLLHRDFEQWFTPNSIESLIVRKYYNEHIRKFYRPTMAKVVHVLVREPVSPRQRRGLSDAEKKALGPAKRKVLKLGKELNRLMQQANPKSAKEFLAVAEKFKRRINTAHPQLQAWYKGFAQVMKRYESRSTPMLTKALKWKSQQLRHLIFCTSCRFLRVNLILARLRKWKKRYKEKVPVVVQRQLLDILKKSCDAPRRLVVVEKLPFFPEVPTRGWPSMVDAFSKATFSIKDGTYTKELVKTSFGYHLIFRIKTSKLRHIPLLRAAPKIRRGLFQAMRPRKYKQWLQLIYKKYKPVGYLRRLRPKRRK